MATKIGFSRAVSAMYEAPHGTALPNLAVVLLDGQVITARPFDNPDEAIRFASDALKILQTLELSDRDFVIEQEL